jgi:type I restriction enzyme S subunit
MSRYKAYSEYRDSGVEWLGNIPCDWDCVRLKFASELSGRKVARRNEERYVGLENVQSNSGKFITTDEVTPEGISNVFSIGDVLFGKLRPYLAKSWLADFSGICSSEFLVMTSRKLDSKFLHYFTLTEEFIKQVDSSTYGSKMPRASWDFIGLLNIPIPSYESEKIAAFLDHETAKIDALIEKQQRLIELLKEKRQAVISHAVTKGLNPNVPMKDSGVEWLGEVPAHWEAKRIKNLSVVKRGASPRPIDEPKYFDDDGEYAWVRIADVSSSGMFLTSTTQRLSSLGSSLSVKLEPNQLFVSIAGTVGKPCLTTFKACIHDGFVYFPELLIDNKFLYYIFAAGEAYLGLGKMGTQLNLNTETVGGITIGVPPADEIMAIIKFIEQATAKYDGLISNAERLIELAQERRTALISAAVTGKIDVRDWQAAA